MFQPLSQQANQSEEMDLTIPKILLQFLDDHLELVIQIKFHVYIVLVN